MIKFILNLFKPKEKVDFSTLLKEGAIILDVRTEEEYKSGHGKNSVNIPLHKIIRNLNKLNKNKPIITVCRSGSRSRNAMYILNEHGFSKVYNGGSWTNFQ